MAFWQAIANLAGLAGNMAVTVKALCLLSNEQLTFDSKISGGLLNLYREHGFIVKHIPNTDPASDPSGWDELNRSLEATHRAYSDLPKPVLIHCSAGIDRTGKVVSYIRQRQKW